MGKSVTPTTPCRSIPKVVQLRALRKLLRRWGERAVICVLALGMASLFASAARGAEQGFSFSGDLTYEDPAYGIDVPVDSDVIARLVYESTTAAEYDLGPCDCASYRQRIYNGFSATFGPLTVRADEYEVEVANNFAFDHGADYVRIVFSSTYFQPFETSLAVNGVPQAAGLLEIFLKDPTGSLLQGNSLPDPAVLSGFPLRNIYLKDAPPEAVFDLVAGLNPPEPLALTVGDFDFDVDVDGSDFLIWQREVGATLPSPADATRNAVVDAADLALWQENFGEAPSSSSTKISIAEPAAVTLVLPLLVLGMIVRRTLGCHAHDHVGMRALEKAWPRRGASVAMAPARR